MISFTRNCKSSDAGHAFIELAIVIPVLFGIAIIGLDLARSLSVRQIANALTREAASMAYRDCSSETNDEKIESCLEGVRDFIAARSNVAGGTAQVILALYDGQSGAIVRRGRVGDSVDASSSRVQYGDSEIPANSALGAAIISHEIVISAEILVPFEPLLAGILPFADGKEFSLGSAYEIYDATIM